MEIIQSKVGELENFVKELFPMRKYKKYNNNQSIILSETDIFTFEYDSYTDTFNFQLPFMYMSKIKSISDMKRIVSESMILIKSDLPTETDSKQIFHNIITNYDDVKQIFHPYILCTEYIGTKGCCRVLFDEGVIGFTFTNAKIQFSTKSIKTFKQLYELTN